MRDVSVMASNMLRFSSFWTYGILNYARFSGFNQENTELDRSVLKLQPRVYPVAVRREPTEISLQRP